MATIKLKKQPAGDAAARTDAARAPVRGSGAGVMKTRPTLAQAQAQRAEREARYQEQLRQRFGDRPPPEAFARRAESPAQQPPRRPQQGPATTPDRAPRSASRAGPRTAPIDGPRSQSQPRPQSPPPQPPRYEPRPNLRPPSRPVRQQRDDDDDDERMPAEHAPGSMRLSKRMSELGIASRREADEWIAKGYVRVDDQIVSALGSRVQPHQRITIDAKAKFQQAQRVTVLVNKPVGYVSGQAEDGYEPAVVLVTPANQWREDRSGTRFLREHLKSLVPAGRLDIDSVGLLILTQDGRVAKQLIGEDAEIEKEYLVRVALVQGTRLPDASLALLRHGLELDGEALRPAHVEWVNDDQLRFVLTQGKKRQIRRMCEAVGLQVLGLKRVRIGQVMLGDLPPGQWRYLRADERFG
jgi:23S rRNA pseudouridine2604 synthase